MPCLSFDSKKPRGFASRIDCPQTPGKASPTEGKPAAVRICIHIEVPERLVPVTMITESLLPLFWLRLDAARGEPHPSRAALAAVSPLPVCLTRHGVQAIDEDA